MEPTGTTFGADALSRIPSVLRAQWARFVASPATLMCWSLRPEEIVWVDAFLSGPMDRATKPLVVKLPFDNPVGHGFAVANAVLPELVAYRARDRDAYTLPSLPDGLRDVEALAYVLASFHRHVQGTWVRTLALVLEPERVGDVGAWTSWLGRLAERLARLGPGVRILVRHVPPGGLYDALPRSLGASSHVTVADLRVGARATAVVEATADASQPAGALRIQTARVMQAVDEGRLDAAERAATEAHAHVAGADATHAWLVPLHFAIGNALSAAHRFDDAVGHFRRAEDAAARAEAAGNPYGLRLRVLARFGTGAVLVGSDGRAALAAEWYQATVPLCQQLGDARLELEAHRMTCVAYERLGRAHEAWNAGVNALAVVDRLTEEARPTAMLGSLADSLHRLTERGPLESYRPALVRELERRAMAPTRHE